MDRQAPLLKLPNFALYYWLVLVTFFVFVATFVVYVQSEKEIDHANDLRHRSFFLADELRQSSDDLTRMVRTYVATGDVIYKQHYQEILEIRDGKRPRPVDYQNVYWDLVMADDSRPRAATTEAVPLLSLMRQAGFTERELAKLGEAKANSDVLTRTEFAAMQLVESTTLAIAPERIRAIQMLHDMAYHQAKARIMAPIHEFYAMAEERTETAVRVAEKMAIQLRFIVIMLGVLLIVLILRVRQNQLLILGGNLNDIYAAIVRLGSGDFTVAIPVPSGRQDSVLAWLSAMQVNLAELDQQRKLMEEQIRQLAFYDPLTKLPNRRLFVDRLVQSMAASKRNACHGALMFLDLDNFKPLNDTYGHGVGDLLLVAVAERLKACVREMDTVARFGGDEFVVMISELEADRPEAVAHVGVIAEKIRSALSEPYQLIAGEEGWVIEHHCTVSIGVTLFIDGGASQDDILRWADVAMYQAKDAGRNQIRFHAVAVN